MERDNSEAKLFGAKKGNVNFVMISWQKFFGFHS